MGDARLAPPIRAALGILLLVVMAGTGAELILIEHTEGPWQLVPLVLLLASMLAVAIAWYRPNATVVRTVQGLMGLLMASGAVGLWLHYRANAEFELEMYPALSGWRLFWKAVHGASPPSLAPGAMTAIGALGLIWTSTGDIR